jgi:SAM-dependent methyltransferase
MSKQSEIDYMKNLGEDGRRHAANKPFSESNRGALVMEIGAILCLLPPPPAKVLDCGCGTGWTSCILARSGYDVTGLDISPDMIHFAELNRAREDEVSLRFVVSDFETSRFDSEFDCVLFFDALHHSQDEYAALSSAYSALKPGGICLMSEPGLGHHLRQGAKEVVERYGVAERDMQPSRVIRAGKKAGFTGFEVCPRAQMLAHVLYGNQSYALPGKVVWFVKKRLLRYGFIRTLAAIFLITLYKKIDGFVILRKPNAASR